MAGEPDVRRTAVFIGLWVVGRRRVGIFAYGLLFTLLSWQSSTCAGFPGLQVRCETALSAAQLRARRLSYLSRTREPLIFWLLSALRKLGTRRSISSK